MTEKTPTDESVAPESAPCAGFPPAGEKAEARRVRHSFRFCVLTVVVFTGMLWVSEKYMRYDLTESQYISALTLETESARAVLRQVVKRDAEKRESPAPQYLAALAAREESDLILPTYERACKLDPDSAAYAILYGCALFQAERFEEARERFREAGAQPGQNALPRYLEAAACAMLQKASGDFSESLALVAKTNSSDREVKIPQPVWSSALPGDGYWYYRLRRQIADDCCAPLYRFCDVVIAKAKRQVALRQPQYWDSWLEAMQEMGKRVASTGELGAIKATAGIYIQFAALDQREAIRALEQGAVTDLVERRTKLQSAQNLINKFESIRDSMIAHDMERQETPLFLAMKGFAIFFGAFLLSYLAGRLMKLDRRWRALPHNRLMIILTALMAAGFVSLLLVMGAFQRMDMAGDPLATATPGVGHMQVLATLWWVIVVCTLLFGFVYPKMRLNSFREPILKCAQNDKVPVAKLRRAVYFSYLRRYYGIVIGCFLCTICVWALLFRVATTLYPWQIKLLTTGLANQEADIVRLVLSMLQQG